MHNPVTTTKTLLARLRRDKQAEAKNPELQTQFVETVVRKPELFWGEIVSRDHGKRVRVFAESTPSNPERGESYVGIINCPKPVKGQRCVPTLVIGPEVRFFNDWWQVEFLLWNSPV